MLFKQVSVINQVFKKCLVKHAYLLICIEMEGVFTEVKIFITSSLLLRLFFYHSTPKIQLVDGLWLPIANVN